MAIDTLFQLDSVIQSARNTDMNKGILKAIWKHENWHFKWCKLEPGEMPVKAATIMRDVSDGERRAIIVLHVSNLEKLRAESTLRELNAILDGLLPLL